MPPIAYFFIVLFFGVFGVHYFVQKKPLLGVLYLFTGGLFGIGWLVDIIRAGIQCFSSQKNQLQCSTQQPITPAAPFNNSIRKETFFAAGTDYYLPAINRLRKSNPNWNSSPKELLAQGKCMQRIFQYYYTNRPVLLVPEPTNPHDPHAVQSSLQIRW